MNRFVDFQVHLSDRKMKQNFCLDQPDVCATLYDGQNQQGASSELPIGSVEHGNPRGLNNPDRTFVILNDRAESVTVHPGCTLTLFEHGPRYPTRGRVHSFTHDDGSTQMPENNNLAILGLANNTSSWECTCGIPVEHPIACGENEANCTDQLLV